jgi:raffinose/stachyose/melibiose transport system permease protein
VRRLRWSSILLTVLALVWLYPVAWTLANAIRPSADIHRAPWDLAWPPAVDQLGTAWDRAHLGLALAASASVTALTVGGVLLLAICAAYALGCLRPPLRALLFVLVLAPLIIPTEVLIVPMFRLFRDVGLINDLAGLALFEVVSCISFAIVILMGFFRTVPADTLDAARLDGAGRVQVLLAIVVPHARSGIVAVAVLVAVLTWNDYGGAVVLLQRPETFTVQLALTAFSTTYATDQGLTFAGMAIAIVPPLLLVVVAQRDLLRGLAAGASRR